MYILKEHSDLHNGKSIGSDYVGHKIDIQYAKVDEYGMFALPEMEDWLQTSRIKSIDIEDGKIHIKTKNSLYVFGSESAE